MAGTPPGHLLHDCRKNKNITGTPPNAGVADPGGGGVSEGG